MRAGFTPEEVGRRFGPMGWELLHADRMSADAIVVSGRLVDDRSQLWRCRLLHRM
jgi:hypothetical protein